MFHGRYTLPTLREVLDFAAEASRTARRPMGVAPETKHPTYRWLSAPPTVTHRPQRRDELRVGGGDLRPLEHDQ